MKLNRTALAPLAALIVACGVDAPASFGYPYNPNASAVPGRDPRVPYYGDWVWAVVFPNSSARYGSISIAVSKPDGDAALNMGVGLAALCSADGTVCPVTNDAGSIGTGVVEGVARLLIGQVSAAGTVRWTGTDADGLVGSDLKGRAELSGVGVWNDGTTQPVTFALIQVSATPSLTGTVTNAGGLAHRSSPGRLPNTGSLQARAIAVATTLADGR